MSFTLYRIRSAAMALNHRLVLQTIVCELHRGSSFCCHRNQCSCPADLEMRAWSGGMQIQHMQYLLLIPIPSNELEFWLRSVHYFSHRGPLCRRHICMAPNGRLSRWENVGFGWRSCHRFVVSEQGDEMCGDRIICALVPHICKSLCMPSCAYLDSFTLLQYVRSTDVNKSSGNFPLSTWCF